MKKITKVDCDPVMYGDIIFCYDANGRLVDQLPAPDGCFSAFIHENAIIARCMQNGVLFEYHYDLKEKLWALQSHCS